MIEINEGDYQFASARLSDPDCLTWSNFYITAGDVISAVYDLEKMPVHSENYALILTNAASVAMGLKGYFWVLPQSWENEVLHFEISEGVILSPTYGEVEVATYGVIESYYTMATNGRVTRDPTPRHFPSNQERFLTTLTQKKGGY